MRNISSFKHCYGCGVCITACPVQAIRLDRRDGFIKPDVEPEKCINCGICTQICAYAHDKPLLTKGSAGFYSGWSKDQTIRYTSTSGGIITELAHSLLKQGYHVCAAKYDLSSHDVKHVIVKSIDGWNGLSGSKYIQSDFFSDGIRLLKSEQKYLVIGTPCQIDSFRRYIRRKKQEDSYILLDFFCHGVPSKLLWDKYLAYSKVADIQKVSFRNKDHGWHTNSYRIRLEGSGRNWDSALTAGDLFYRFFLRDRCLNPACYDKCMFKATHSSADIRVGDMWGDKYQSDEKGVNAILALTTKGEEVLSSLQTCQINPETKETVLDGQMGENAKRPLSYPFVQQALRSKMTLPAINTVANLLESPAKAMRLIRIHSKALLRKLTKPA